MMRLYVFLVILLLILIIATVNISFYVKKNSRNNVNRTYSTNSSNNNDYLHNQFNSIKSGKTSYNDY